MLAFKRTLLTTALLVGGAATALGHHGWSSYDNSKTLKLTGKATAVKLSNPHATIKLTTDDKDAKTWDVILAPVSRMESRGLTQAQLKDGVTVTVEGYQNKQTKTELRAERITIDGKTTELR